jgi:hypothetical protein
MRARPKTRFLVLALLLLTLPVAAATAQARSAPISSDPPAITGLSSPTNSALRWSRTATPLFLWSPAPGATGYSWIVDHAKDTSPDAVADDAPLGFDVPRSYIAPGDTYSICLGNFNSDGLPDLYLGGSRGASLGSVGVLMSHQVAGSVEYMPWSRPLGAWCSDIAVADFNGDGVDDIAASENAADQVEVLLSSGSGDVVSKTAYPTGDQPRYLAAGDLNGDDHLDLAVTHGENYVTILLGDGSGGFTRAPSDLVVGYWPDAVVVADFNEDGNADIAATSGAEDGGSVDVLLGKGDGTFAEHVGYAVDIGPQDVVSGDLDGDGHIDLAVACPYEGVISVLLGRGDGTFQPRQDLVGSPVGSLAPPADLDGDGHADLTTTDWTGGTADVLLGDGQGSFAPRLSFRTGRSPDGVLTADLDKDGLPDIVTSNDSGSVSLLLGVPRPVTRCILGSLDDGVWYFHVRAVAGASAGPVSSQRLLIDTSKPLPVARPSSGQTGGWASLRFRIRDTRPGSPSAVVKLSIYRNGRFIEMLKCRRKVNVEASLRFKCKLPKGPYRFYILAIDQAGNHQKHVSNNVLTVF